MQAPRREQRTENAEVCTWEDRLGSERKQQQEGEMLRPTIGLSHSFLLSGKKKFETEVSFTSSDSGVFLCPFT